MENIEKLALLEEMLGFEKDSLNEKQLLIQLANWDSIAVMTFIALLDEKFGKSISSATIKELKTIGDILDLME